MPFDRLSFVYDLDTDTTLPFIEKLRADDPRICAEKKRLRPRRLQRVKSGAFHRLKPVPVIVVMGDNSDKLSIVAEMIEMWRAGAIVVSPSRYMIGGKMHGGPLIKGLLSRAAGVSLRLLGFPTSDPTNNFKLYLRGLDQGYRRSKASADSR